MYKFIFPEYGKSYRIISYRTKVCSRGMAYIVAIEDGTGEEHVFPAHFLTDNRMVIIEE